MNNSDTKRLSRLVAILTQLQTRRILRSTMLAEKFGVSVRTIYRDIKALEQAGIPVLAEEGKGYSLMEGYSIPPVMFTESEANALVTAEQIVLKSRDSSLGKEYSEAINKIKAVLRYSIKEKIELLATRIAVSPALSPTSVSNSLTLVQHALTSFTVLNISYQSEHKNEKTNRDIEPFAFYYSMEESWSLIAYCHLREDYRMFRLDRMLNVQMLNKHFAPHKLTLAAYLENKQSAFQHP